MEVEKEAKLDEIELSNLQKAISQVETALAVSRPGNHSLFENFLINAKSRAGVLEKKIKDAEIKQQEHAKDEIALADLARKEAALNETEKETYSSFLKEEFFTKKDFGRLEQFYEKTWDRLSESGKDQMSQRVWEGIRRDEYTFSELPESVKEKEAKQAYKLFRESSSKPGNLDRIPENYKEDFIRAYESGRQNEAGKILERETFKENMFQDKLSREIHHSAVSSNKEADRAAITMNLKNTAVGLEEASPPKQQDSMAELDLSSINLTEMKPVENSAQDSLTNLSKKTSTSLRGC